MITQQHGRALGSDIVLTVRVADSSTASPLLAQLRSFLREFEGRFSRFDPNSELTMVNEHAGEETAISDEFYELASRAHRMEKETGGLYNPLLLPELQRAGYVGSWPAPERRGTAPDYQARQSRHHEGMVLTEADIRIPAGTALDFGGIGKGYALDQLADIAEHARLQRLLAFTRR